MTDSNPTPHTPDALHSFKRNPALYALGTFGFSGASPIMPGTVGSIAAMGVVVLVEAFWQPLVGVEWLIASLLMLVFGIAVGNRVERDMGAHDPGWFVLDEVAGVWLAYWMVLASAWIPEKAMPQVPQPWLVSIFVALIFFRVYDIAKPWPIRRVERLKAGYGIMLDDMVAGVLAGLSGFLAIFLWRLAL